MFAVPELMFARKFNSQSPIVNRQLLKQQPIADSQSPIAKQQPIADSQSPIAETTTNRRESTAKTTANGR
jgi:hypothetical protein